MVILGREKLAWPIIGCCGMGRDDIIYPVGTELDIEGFKRRALEIVKGYETGDDENETYSLEYFKGEPEQNFREDGESLILIEKVDDKWIHSIRGKEIFRVSNYNELKLYFNI
jgi:hypothetical protein